MRNTKRNLSHEIVHMYIIFPFSFLTPSYFGHRFQNNPATRTNSYPATPAAILHVQGFFFFMIHEEVANSVFNDPRVKLKNMQTAV